MANEFDNTDPLQLSETPQAAVPDPVQQQAAIPDPVQPQQPVQQQPEQQQPVQRELTNEDRIDFYRRKGYSDSQIVNILDASGKATRHQAQGIMQAQQEIRNREILAENERLKKKQAEAEKHMIESRDQRRRRGD